MKFLSSIFSSVSGSIGGTTYWNNAGLNARSRISPINPNTLAQQNVRANLSTAAFEWGELTDAQRTAWDDYAALTPLTNKLGQSFNPSGFMMWVRWCSSRLLVGESITQPSPLATSGLGAPPTAIIVEDPSMAATITVTIAGGAADDGNCFAQISGVLSSGINSVRRPLTFDSEVDVASAATTAVITPVFTPVIGNRRVVRTRLVYDDGRVSAIFEQIVTVIAS